jgi:predicted nucleic acid-binding protein
MWKVYTPDGMTLEETVTDPETGEDYSQLIDIPSNVLEKLEGTVKVDITPKGAFDKFAQELSLENLLKAGYFSVERLNELKVYVKLLDDDSTMPKAKLEEAIELMEEEQRKIAAINAQAQLMQQQANQFLNSDVDAQAEQLSEAQMQAQIEAERTGMAAEREATAEERGDIEE